MLSQTSTWDNNYYNKLIAAGMLAAILFVAAVAWRAASRALRPVEFIRAELSDISTNDITRRIHVPLSAVRRRAAVGAGIAAAVVLCLAVALLGRALMSDIGGTMFTAVPVAALFVATVAWWVTGVALQPVEAIRTELADITASEISRRVPIPRSGDEITKLAITTNATLDRLQAAIDRQRRFVADAAHELRSPLTSLRNSLEVAVAHPERTDWPEVVHIALNDAKRLHALTDDLLLLARLDRAAAQPDHVVDLAALVEEQVFERRYLHPDGPRILACTEACAPVAGNESELGRLLRNLLDNAGRYARTTVTVAVTMEPGHVILEVRDDGPGIPAPDRERIFERFVRVDEARDRGAGGTGLGLAIVRDIATRHGGTVHIGESTSGARIIVRLPLEPPSVHGHGPKNFN
jgi:signal transduction histidine kinase